MRVGNAIIPGIKITTHHIPVESVGKSTGSRTRVHLHMHLGIRQTRLPIAECNGPSRFTLLTQLRVVALEWDASFLPLIQTHPTYSRRVHLHHTSAPYRNRPSHSLPHRRMRQRPHRKLAAHPTISTIRLLGWVHLHQSHMPNPSHQAIPVSADKCA